MRMTLTVAAVIAAAGIPAVGLAQGSTPDSAKQGTATGRRVNEVNESGDTTRSALRDSVLRNATNTRSATPTRSGASATANAREGAATGSAPLADSIQTMRGNQQGRPVPMTNEGGDTTRSALRDSLLRNSTRTPGAAVAPSTDASTGGAAGATSGGAMLGSLSGAQVRQLQQALNGAGCDAGRVDGRVGAKTRAAMRCARQKNGISGNDDQALFRALGLSF